MVRINAWIEGSYGVSYLKYGFNLNKFRRKLECQNTKL